MISYTELFALVYMSTIKLKNKQVLLPYVSGHSVYKICNTDKHLLDSLIWLSDKKEIIKLSAKCATVNKDKPFDISSNR